MKDGNPVWIGKDGKESPHDAGAILDRLTEVTGESVARKNKVRELESKLEVLSGIEEPEKFIADAKKAMVTVKNLDDKQLIDAGKVAEIKKDLETKLAESQKTFEAELKKRDDIIAAKKEAIESREIKGVFDRSSFIPEKSTLVPSFAFEYFRRNFKVSEEENGEMSVIAVRGDGKEIFSADPKRAGKYATPEEAIEILINEHPDKDRLLKGTTPGSGTRPGTPGGKTTISRQQFDGLDATSRSRFIKDGGAVQD